MSNKNPFIIRFTVFDILNRHPFLKVEQAITVLAELKRRRNNFSHLGYSLIDHLVSELKPLRPERPPQ